MMIAPHAYLGGTGPGMRVHTGRATKLEEGVDWVSTTQAGPDEIADSAEMIKVVA